MVIALAALVAVALTIGLTSLWQRQSRSDRRLVHVENEIGIGDEERVRVEEGKVPKRPHQETLRVRLHVIDRRFDAVTGRMSRLARAR